MPRKPVDAKARPPKQPSEPKEPAQPKAPPRGLPSAKPEAAEKALLPTFRKMVSLRADKARLEREQTELTAELEEVNKQLVEGMDQFGCQNLTITGLGLFYRTQDDYPSVQDERALFADLKRRKMSNVIKETVHYATLKSAVKELKEKKDPPLKGVDVFEKQVVRFRAEKTKG